MNADGSAVLSAVYVPNSSVVNPGLFHSAARREGHTAPRSAALCRPLVRIAGRKGSRGILRKVQDFLTC